MTQSSIGFISYRPYPSNKKIALANGNFISCWKRRYDDKP